MFAISALTIQEIRDRNARIERLLAAIACGDTASMGELYDVIKTDVYAYALSKTENRFEAEDITQDTFVRIYRYAKLYRPQGKPMAWIIKIELNLILGRFRVQSRSVPLDEGFENVPLGKDFEDEVADNSFLREIMTRLSREEREVIALHVVSGMKHREIAKLLQKPLSTVLSKYNRAIKKLRAAVKETE